MTIQTELPTDYTTTTALITVNDKFAYYMTTTDLSTNYALKCSLPNMSFHETKIIAEGKCALKTSIFTDYVNSSALNDYALKREIPEMPDDYITIGDMESYALKTGIPSVVQSDKVTGDAIKRVPSLSYVVNTYTTQTEMNSLANQVNACSSQITTVNSMFAKYDLKSEILNLLIRLNIHVNLMKLIYIGKKKPMLFMLKEKYNMQCT